MSKLARLPRISRLGYYQILTVFCLFIGYTGYYICRSHFSVSTPLILKEYDHDTGIGLLVGGISAPIVTEKMGKSLHKSDLGDIISLGILLYAVGKLLNGFLTDYLGGRTTFLLGMLGAIACTLAFGWSGPWLPFAFFWGMNRFLQSMGWPGLINISANWFPPSRQATILGILSLSYLLGDAFARWYLGNIIGFGFDWRELFFFAASTLGIIFVINFIFLKKSPVAYGLLEVPTVENLPFTMQNSNQPIPWRTAWIGLLTSLDFLLISAMNFGLTFIRETFNDWNPTFLSEVVGLTPNQAARSSALFPLWGAFGALVGGYLVDRLNRGYSPVMVPALLGLITTLLILGFLNLYQQVFLMQVLLGTAAFCLMVPYTFCAGSLALQVGGKHAGATASGLIDTFGYLGGFPAGFLVARIAQYQNWGAVFQTLAVVACLTLIVTILFGIHRSRSTSKNALSR